MQLIASSVAWNKQTRGDTSCRILVTIDINLQIYVHLHHLQSTSDSQLHQEAENKIKTNEQTFLSVSDLSLVLVR